MRTSVLRECDAGWRRTCPWCGREFETPYLMQDHERRCPDWGDPKGGGDG